MRAGITRFLEHRDGQRCAAMLFLQLCESKRRGQPGGAAADNQDVDVESFALHEELTTKVTCFAIFVPSWFLLLELGHDRGHDLEQVADDAVVGNLENGSVRILVDGNNRPRSLHSHEVLDGS